MSPGSAAAVRRAAELCSSQEACLHLVHVLSPSRARFGSLFRRVLGQQAVSPGNAVALLRQAAARLEAEYCIPVETHVRVGRAAVEIADCARQAGADLVVLGNPPDSRLRRALRAGTAVQVHWRTGLPVLAVSQAVSRLYGPILMPCDLSQLSAATAQRARRLFPDSRLVLLYAYEPPGLKLLPLRDVSEDVAADYRQLTLFQGMSRLHLFAREASLEKAAVMRVALEAPVLSIRRMAAELEADLVALRLPRRWRPGGVSERLVARPPCDVLLMP